jgi:uncharacterized protein YraI
VICLVAFAAPTVAQDLPVASVNTGSLNVRSGPGMQFGSIATLPFGFGVPMIARNSEGNWILIQLTTGLTGWVNINYIFTQYPTRSLPITDQPISSDINPTGRSNAFTLELRQGPSREDTVIRVVGLDVRFQLLGRNFNGQWAQIRLDDGTVGWVETRYIVTSVPVRSSEPRDGSVFVPNAPSQPPGQPGTNPPGAARFHLVQPGETLTQIATRYGVTVQSIVLANGIYNPDRIYYGTTLVIPG